MYSNVCDARRCSCSFKLFGVLKDRPSYYFYFSYFFFAFGSFCFHFVELFFSLAHFVQLYLVWGFSCCVAFNCFNLKCLPLRYIKTVSQGTLLVLSRTRSKQRSMAVAGRSEKENRKMKKAGHEHIHNILFTAREKQEWWKKNRIESNQNCELNVESKEEEKK